MDRITNPYSPGAGSPPPELAGREAILEQARILLGRVRASRAEKSLLLTGLRGVGKTVLLNEIERVASATGYHTVSIEAQEGRQLGSALAPQLRRLLHEVDRIKGVGDGVRRALAVLRSFIGAVSVKVGELDIGLDIEPEPGFADTGDLQVDLPQLFMAVGEAALERGAAVVLLIDEIQYLSAAELGALIMAMHRVQQRQLPVALAGAGLPILPALMGESKSYAERLFNFPSVGPLADADARMALRCPARAANVEFTDEALDEILKHAQGYPYFIQEWGYQVWNHASASPIDREVVETASVQVSRRLDENFFRVRFERLRLREKVYLRAMAALGPGPHRTADIANELGLKITALGPLRANLITKGMIFSPSYGEVAFTVPLFGEFMKRIMPGDDWRG